MGDVSANFYKSDFQCNCPRCIGCADSPTTKPETIRALQKVRDLYAKPIVVSAGVRCRDHNAHLGGSSDSRHLPEHADAVDVKCSDSETRFDLVAAVMALGDFTFIEIAPKHLHFDQRPGDRRLILGEDH